MKEKTAPNNNPTNRDSNIHRQQMLFKYLDINGAKAMLGNSNLQFTNAAELNDPFDCHPGLVAISDDIVDDITIERLSKLEIGYFPTTFRGYTYLCSLSKNFDSILMWSYYTKDHKGVCVGINMPKLNRCFPFIDFCVEYPDTLTKYDCASGNRMGAFKHQLATKAPEWKHENEVRLLLPPTLPLSEDRHRRPPISGECFAVIYLGVNMNKKDRVEIIKLARTLNPDIRIYQMQVNPTAFKLDCIEVV